MQANPALLCALFLPLAMAVSLRAQDSSTQDAVNRLEASRTFGVSPAPSAASPSAIPSDVSGKEVDISRVLDRNSFQNSPFAPPPLEEIAPPQSGNNRPVRRPTNNVTDKDSDWLLKGVEEQRKLMEERDKALNKDTASKDPFAEDPLNRDKSSTTADRDKDKDKSKDRTTKTGSNSSPFNSGLGVYSRYTVSGMDAMKAPGSTSTPDPLSLDAVTRNPLPKSSVAVDDPLTAPIDGTRVRSVIIDPLATTKLDTNTPNASSRLSVNDWLASVKERERASLLPQQAPTMQDLYDQNKVHAKAPDPVLTKSAPVVNSRPAANTMRNSLPPNKVIKDPNDF